MKDQASLPNSGLWVSDWLNLKRVRVLPLHQLTFAF